ncbi:MAG: bifunctional 3-(3-hydroxy-phenyl)propionate/3-hydroxycinnamic acid hydroxylase [Acidimicrobiales bacterium]
MTEPDVIVVGFGPVGATLTGLLARAGCSVLALERDTGLYPLPRAAHLDGEGMRVLQSVGCADEIAPALRANDGMDFVAADGTLLLQMRSDRRTAAGWPSSNLFHQPGLEGPLRATVAALPGVEVRLGVEVTAVVDRGDHVEVTAGGRIERAGWVIGVDGARSFVRRVVPGLDEHNDAGFEEPWLVVDLVLGAEAPPLPDHAVQLCDPARPATLVPMPAPRHRVEVMLLPGDDPTAIAAPARVTELLTRWLPEGSYAVERAAVYTFHGLVGRRWRSGRVLLAGDACHQMPPFLGQGMCSGLRDAANLAWKLAAVAHGDAPDALLDTYQAERAPQVQGIVDAAVGFGRIICTTDAAVAAQRDASFTERGPRTQTSAPMPALALGPLVLAGGGRPVPQAMLAAGRLDDVVGPRWAVLHRGPIEGAAAAFWHHRGAVFLDAADEPSLVEVLDALHADVIVVRPDRYVLGAGADLIGLTDPVRPLLAV